jgi:hypothetical protein
MRFMFIGLSNSSGYQSLSCVAAAAGQAAFLSAHPNREFRCTLLVWLHVASA